MLRKNLVKWTGKMLALALGIGLLPVGTANSGIGMVTAKAAELDEGPDDYDLEMTEEQLQYIYLENWESPSAIRWIDDPGNMGIGLGMDRWSVGEGMGAQDWKYEGVCIREATVKPDAYSGWNGTRELILENLDKIDIPVKDSKMLHFSDSDYDYYIGKCYVVKANGDYDDNWEFVVKDFVYYKRGYFERINKNTNEISSYYELYPTVYGGTEEVSIENVLGEEANSMDPFYRAMRYATAMRPGNAENPTTSETSTTPAAPETSTTPTAPETSTTPTAPETSTTPTNAEVTYTVKKGDTLSSIATKFYGNNASRYKIKSYNKTAFQKSNGKLVPGMEIQIPALINGQKRLPEISLADGEKLYTVKLGDTLFKIAKAQLGNGNRYKEIFERNSDRIKKASQIYEGQEIVIPAK